METVIVLFITFFIGLAFKVKGLSSNKSLAVASLTMPSFVLLSEFILPHKGGGASMWPIALLFGTIYGAIIGGLGVFTGAYFLKWKSKKR